MVDNEIALDLTLYLRNEKDYVPWMSALSNMAYIATQFSTYDSVERGSKPAYPVYKVRCPKISVQFSGPSRQQLVRSPLKREMFDALLYSPYLVEEVSGVQKGEFIYCFRA